MAPPRVLLVDDEEAITFALKRYLAARGFEVDSAGCLREVEEHLSRAPYDVVVTDLRLQWSGEEGFAVLAAVRRQSSGAKVLLLTGFVTGAVEKEARARGAAMTLAKPIPLAELSAIVAALANEGRSCGSARC